MNVLPISAAVRGAIEISLAPVWVCQYADHPDQGIQISEILERIGPSSTAFGVLRRIPSGS